MEVGSGSGYVITSLSLLLQHLGLAAHCIATDINPAANAATRHTLAAHKVCTARRIILQLCTHDMRIPDCAMCCAGDWSGCCPCRSAAASATAAGGSSRPSGTLHATTSVLCSDQSANVCLAGLVQKGCLGVTLAMLLEPFCKGSLQTLLAGCCGPRLQTLLVSQIFNPPYVPTPDEELHRDGIARAWAGGKHGRAVIDRFLPLVRSPCSVACNHILEPQH